MIELLFWASAAFVVYAYFGYGAILYLIALFKRSPVGAADVRPTITMVIAVRNEERRLPAKLENTLALDYPPDRLEIIVASDCSDDGTDAIALAHAPRGVRLIAAPERRGKEYAQRLAIESSTGEILVFTDVATRVERTGLCAIVRSFADPTIGCVSSVDRMIDATGRVSGEGAYVRYEMFLRKLETQVGSVVGLSGSFFAARRTVCDNWATDIPSDFSTLLNALRLGLRGVSDPAAVGYYRDLADTNREYQRKVRTIVRGLAGLGRHLELLNPFKYGLFAWQLFSHKLCRWLVPFALIVLFAANLWLLPTHPAYVAIGLIQMVAYATAVVGLRTAQPLTGVRRIITFLVMANLSTLNAWYEIMRGRRVVAWEPSRR
jgi:hypothetical protein